ncbi:MAG: ornithine carbamoyltransferase [Fibrella sp.]|nr:ornithine carbamoyltransferase [Armatimonadota bacterium]
MAIQFTRNGRKAMLWAQVEAMRRGELYVEPEHLLLGLTHGEDTGALRLLDRLNLSPLQVREAISVSLKPESAGTRVASSQLSPVAKKVVEQARRETEVTGDDYVGTEHLLLAILRSAENGIDNREDAGGYISLQFMGLNHERAAAALIQAGEDAKTAEIAGEPVRTAFIGSTPKMPKIPARPGFIKGRHVLSVNDLTTEEIRALFDLTRDIKMGRNPDNGRNKTLAMIFEKPSLRTRATFSVAMTRLGGTHVYMAHTEVGLGTRETPRDVAKCLSRWVDAVAARTHAHQTVVELAEHSTVPVISALTDREHPCQAFADFYTILEHRSETAGMKLVFVGDGNNVAQSLMLLAPRLGTHFTLACPPGYEPDSDMVAQAEAMAAAHGTRFEITHDALAAADDADILYTDVWTSMGQEQESEKRMRDFTGYQINGELLREAKDDVLVMHCLPAHRGHEISDEAMDGKFSVVFDQAENRLHVQQALLAAVL